LSKQTYPAKGRTDPERAQSGSGVARPSGRPGGFCDNAISRFFLKGFSAMAEGKNDGLHNTGTGNKGNSGLHNTGTGNKGNSGLHNTGTGNKGNSGLHNTGTGNKGNDGLHQKDKDK